MKKIEVVAAIIHKGNYYLATQRGYGYFEGMWEFPGGKIEKYLCTVDYDYPNFHLTMHCYHCCVSDGVIKLLEHLSAKWLTKDELKEVEWLPADVEVAKRLLSK